MNDEVRKNLVDVLQAAEEIRGFTHEMDFRAYKKSQVTQRAVERDFENVSEHHRIIGFRNILIHTYRDRKTSYV